MRKHMTLFFAVNTAFSILTSGYSIKESSNTGNGTDAVVKRETAKEEASQPSGSSEKTGEMSLVDQLVSECSALSGIEAYDFFTTLADRGLSQGDIIDFFIKSPISQVNKEICDLYISDASDIYAESAPNGIVHGDYFWTMGDGMGVTGPYSDNTNLRMMYTNYIPVDEGPIGNSSKTYKVGVVAINAIDSWMGNLYDSIQYKTDRHESLGLVWMDYGLDSDGCSDTIDILIVQNVDVTSL